MSNGQGCTCNAWSENECACGADWTPQEVYALRAENNRLKAENKLYAAEMSAAKEDGFYSAQDLYSSYVGAEERVNTLESELAACREDAERLESTKADGLIEVLYRVEEALLTGAYDDLEIASWIRAAIDATMGKERPA